MSDTSIEVFWGMAVVAVIGLLIVVGIRVVRTARRGLGPILVGLSLILFGGLLSLANRMAVPLPLRVLDDVAVQRLLRDVVGYLGGSAFLAIGLIRWLATASAAEQVERLNDALAKMGRKLQSDQELLSSMMTSSISGVMIMKVIRDEDGTIIDFECQLMNHEAEQLLGLSAGALVGQGLLYNLLCIRGGGGLFQEGVSVVETRLPFRDERSCTHGGRNSWYQIVAVKHGDGIVVNFADVTDRRRHEEQLRYAALHDPLTGLPNRALFNERLEQAISHAKRDPKSKFALLFLDLDRFKAVNDSLGHEIGDGLLISLAERLRENLRVEDTASRVEDEQLPARLGGDEFAVLLEGITAVEDVTHIAERLQKALSAPYMIGDNEVISTASVGVVTSDADCEHPDDVLRAADAAMYQAKYSGKARFVVFDERMHREAVERLNLEKQLRQAVEQDEFKLVFQPIVSLRTAGLVGFEALIRWSHPQSGTVLPAAFIGVAEDLGLMVPIGKWVLAQACHQLKRWRHDHPDHPTLSVSVNISKQQLQHPDLIPTIVELVEETGIDAEHLQLEITETSIASDADLLAPTLARLRKVGVRLAMDDFGTGHSSLSFLQHVPMDILKIDRSFIASAAKTRDRAAIIHAVVQLAHNLKMQVVAEGIETHDQLVLLQALDCNYGQGFLFSKPLAAEAADELLSPEYRFTIAA